MTTPKRNKNLSLQRQIFAAVAERGYVEKWLPLQFMARNVVKLLEETCELFLVFEWRHPALVNLRNLVVMVREQSRIIFDDETLWKPKEPYQIDVDLESLKTELSDVGVVMACIVEMFGVLNNEIYNLWEWAVIKATGDIKRGIRAGKKSYKSKNER